MKAFPKSKTEEPYQDGMDLRDYFAAKAMQSLISHYGEEFNDKIGMETSMWSYKIANRMMEARNE